MQRGMETTRAAPKQKEKIRKADTEQHSRTSIGNQGVYYVLFYDNL
jgi:hypothetical protein